MPGNNRLTPPLVLQMKEVTAQNGRFRFGVEMQAAHLTQFGRRVTEGKVRPEQQAH